MNLTTICRYGVRAMIELGAQYGGSPIPLKVIAEKQEISRKYLDHIMRRLKNAGLLRVVRGVNGGFQLARPPEEIKLNEIFHILEGKPYVVECVNDPILCNRSENCPTREIWLEIAGMIEKYLASRTLGDLIRGARKKSRPRRRKMIPRSG